MQPFLGLKNFIGYFLDNEPEWHPAAIFAFYLGLPKDSPGSRALLRFLKVHYQGSLGRLNRHWGTAYASFESIPGSPPPAGASLPMARGLLRAWRTEVAGHLPAVRRHGAHPRPPSPHPGRPLPRDSRYGAVQGPLAPLRRQLHQRLQPVWPSEAGLCRIVPGQRQAPDDYGVLLFGFPHPGHQTGLFIDVYSQAWRGLGYHKYVLEAARAPSLVGMHWFMWRDYGKQDKRREGYPYPPDENVGLLSPDEAVVYEELGRWVRRTNAAVEELMALLVQRRVRRRRSAGHCGHSPLL